MVRKKRLTGANVKDWMIKRGVDWTLSSWQVDILVMHGETSWAFESLRRATPKTRKNEDWAWVWWQLRESSEGWAANALEDFIWYVAQHWSPKNEKSEMTMRLIVDVVNRVPEVERAKVRKDVWRKWWQSAQSGGSDEVNVYVEKYVTDINEPDMFGLPVFSLRGVDPNIPTSLWPYVKTDAAASMLLKRGIQPWQRLRVDGGRDPIPYVALWISQPETKLWPRKTRRQVTQKWMWSLCARTAMVQKEEPLTWKRIVRSVLIHIAEIGDMEAMQHPAVVDLVERSPAYFLEAMAYLNPTKLFELLMWESSEKSKKPWRTLKWTFTTSQGIKVTYGLMDVLAAGGGGVSHKTWSGKERDEWLRVAEWLNDGNLQLNTRSGVEKWMRVSSHLNKKYKKMRPLSVMETGHPFPLGVRCHNNESSIEGVNRLSPFFLAFNTKKMSGLSNESLEYIDQAYKTWSGEVEKHVREYMSAWSEEQWLEFAKEMMQAGMENYRHWMKTDNVFDARWLSSIQGKTRIVCKPEMSQFQKTYEASLRVMDLVEDRIAVEEGVLMSVMYEQSLIRDKLWSHLDGYLRGGNTPNEIRSFMEGERWVQVWNVKGLMFRSEGLLGRTWGLTPDAADEPFKIDDIMESRRWTHSYVAIMAELKNRELKVNMVKKVNREIPMIFGEAMETKKSPNCL